MKTPQKTRPTMGTNPLDALMSTARTRSSGPVDPPPVRPAKVRATFHLQAEIFNEIRDAVVALSGPPHRLTLAAFAEIALRAKLEELKKTENKGKPFPKRAGELRGGRPIGS